MSPYTHHTNAHSPHGTQAQTHATNHMTVQTALTSQAHTQTQHKQTHQQTQTNNGNTRPHPCIATQTATQQPNTAASTQTASLPTTAAVKVQTRPLRPLLVNFGFSVHLPGRALNDPVTEPSFTDPSLSAHFALQPTRDFTSPAGAPARKVLEQALRLPSTVECRESQILLLWRTTGASPGGSLRGQMVPKRYRKMGPRAPAGDKGFPPFPSF